MVRRNINIFNIKKKRKRVYINSGCIHSSINNIKGNKIYLNDDSFIQSLIKYIGQTITIFTVSGGESGSGFTGALLDVKKDYIKILTKAESSPQSTNPNSEDREISLGIITDIPICKIAAFVHNII